ncbi:DUF1206 domain-containing protein [Sinorhizobium meliloti]|uniref:DUF1206 domain-containing protein n=1 Tax=Rhizobium meliloti TaxID=382 RepID=UPI000FD9F010|nr:DUF1206 domain-containing protein [Sinorhizobium meliloti]MQX91919.1 DUF1206 domain-containing protein [Sinorhizobium meliloti]RVG80649.1 DUF1206 domain-containing protein [Sinorhizobium meliloti]RVI36480.1 DUF1206 domain-containing protein [Sinorhizobium meliloti]RVI42010.1 DUF1206 domain-containing protein [Sinorhizobium meliloti]RVJ22633.1 DUF1206 domain-containing protein [Sinorhizobium meliloti]
MISRFRFDLLAKAGYTARGVVFLLVAGLALFSGVKGGQPEMKSALLTLLGQPFGRVWVGLIGVGLLGFVAWRLAQSLADSDGHGSDRKGLTVRSALFGSAAIYLGLAGYALGHALFFAGGDQESGEKGLAEWIMSKPFGSYLAIAIGIGFIVGGVVTAYKGLTRKFERYLRIPDRNRVLTLICIYGLVARGAVFVIIGILFAYAGFRVDPEQAGSISDALEWLRQLPFGSILYIAVAAGIAAFGIYNLVEARYRVVRGPDLTAVKQPISLQKI